MTGVTDKEQLMDGQQTIFDLDIWSGKMCQELLAQTREKTSGQSSKRRQKWQKGMPAYLDLRMADGHTPDVSWEMGGALLGAYTMRSFGESPSEERESRLSQILEENPHPKYCLSERACQGILRRAENRGKTLPPMLEMALRNQAGQSASRNEQENLGGKGILIQDEHTGALSTLNNQSVCYSIGSNNSEGMKSDNPTAGIHEADTARSLDSSGGNPACYQGGICVLEGNGQRESHKGDGYAESEISYTLNTIERHAVCCKQDATEPEYETYQKTTGTLSPGAHAGSYNGQDAYNDMLVCSPAYGIDRAAFNQGQNAKYDFSVKEEQAQTLVSRGPGGYLPNGR